MKAFITDVLADQDLHEIMRAERAVNLLPLLAKKDPQGARSLFKEHYAAIRISPGAGNVIPECLGAWAKNDPFAAVKRIMTLPPGKERDTTLKHIHMNWPDDDPAGKEAYAKEHGIK